MRRVKALLVIAIVVAGCFSATPGAVLADHSSGTTGMHVRGCFIVIAQGSIPYANSPVYLYKWGYVYNAARTGGSYQWVLVHPVRAGQTGSTDGYGCATFRNLSKTGYYMIVASAVGTRTTPYATVPQANKRRAFLSSLGTCRQEQFHYYGQSGFRNVTQQGITTLPATDVAYWETELSVNC